MGCATAPPRMGWNSFEVAPQQNGWYAYYTGAIDAGEIDTLHNITQSPLAIINNKPLVNMNCAFYDYIGTKNFCDIVIPTTVTYDTCGGHIFDEMFNITGTLTLHKSFEGKTISCNGGNNTLTFIYK